MTDPQELRAIVAAWWEDTFVNDYVIDRSGNYRNAEDCIEDIVIRARAARRPRPQSLAEEALLAIDTAVADGRLSPAVAHQNGARSLAVYGGEG